MAIPANHGDKRGHDDRSDVVRWFKSEQFTVHGPAIVGSMLIAELFYKFHSFTLECLAFLATWYVLHLPLAALRRALRPSVAETIQH